MRISRAATAVSASVAAVCAGAALAGAAVRSPETDYGVRVAGPVDLTGAPTHARVTAGAPFLVRVELFGDATQGGPSVAYDLELPTGVRVAARPLRLHTGAVTSSCLRACTVGWNAARSQRLFVYYELVTPGPGDFIVEASLVSSNRRDARPDDNTSSATIVAVPPRLTLGLPLLPAGPPVAGRVFRVAVPVNGGSGPPRPTGGRCVASIGNRSLGGTASFAPGLLRCSWRIPAGSAGRSLRTAVTARAGALRASGSWRYSIQPSRR